MVNKNKYFYFIAILAVIFIFVVIPIKFFTTPRSEETLVKGADNFIVDNNEIYYSYEI